MKGDEMGTVRHTHRNCEFEFAFVMDRKQIKIEDLPWHVRIQKVVNMLI